MQPKIVTESRFRFRLPFRVPRAATFVLATLSCFAAFAGATGDPIVGDYEGHSYFKIRVLVDGRNGHSNTASTRQDSARL